ncbi:hypothetical protein Q31b_08700 [Novipirellula aureliae]|uniref:Antitoxin ParD4 n=1 Tax=Novipirellula aureliae TaxID=2527966 RepID=A0A5C6EB23_9BACT|nr:hypothetical protein [Novipirellula aureliae]TWU45694.1 hypothetical protein Q31b_08700 [Novipirellula aureliae]
MSIQLPPSEQSAAEQLVALGKFASVEEVVVEGVRRLVSSEQLREQVQAGIEQANQGDLVDHDTLFAKLRDLATASNADAE